MQKIKIRLSVPLLLVLILAVLLSGCLDSFSGAKIAVIPLSGTITADSQGTLLSLGGITPDLVRDYLDRAASDANVKAIVLRVESPGGSAAASQEIARDIKRFKEETGKIVVVSMGDTAASGGYYISVYADNIVANPSTLTGSIGVISQFYYIDGLLEKLGLEMEVIKAGEYKDMGLQPLSEEERQIMQAIIDDMYEDFVGAVAEGRGLDNNRVRELATGQPYTGNQALELGLVDELGGLEEAIELAAELAGLSEYRVEEYTPPAPSILDSLLGGVNSTQPLSPDELFYLKVLQGWQLEPRY
jgi:protease-4